MSEFTKYDHCRLAFHRVTTDSVAGKQLQQKLGWIRKASWSSRPTVLRPTSPTTRPGTTDPSSCHSSIHPAVAQTPPTNLSLRSLLRRRPTTRSWTLCRTQPSQTPRTPRLGFTMPGWLGGAEVLQPLCGFPQVIRFVSFATSICPLCLSHLDSRVFFQPAYGYSLR